MRKIIIIAILASIPSLISAQKYLKLYNEGVELFKMEKFKEADSLFSKAISKADLNNYGNYSNLFFDRGVARLNLSDTCGFCKDMESAMEYYDRQAKILHKIICLKCNTEAYNYYQKGYNEFNQKNYLSSDSLLTLSINTYEFVDNIFQRGITRLYLKDTIGFCIDMKKISNIDDTAMYNFQQICMTNNFTGNPIEYIQQPCSCSFEGEIENENNNEEGYGNEIFFVVENMPTFEGNNSDAFRFYIQNNLRYPIEAQRNGIQGRVFVQFDICKNGELRNAVIVRSAHEFLDNEVLRVLSTSPKWSPGLQRGKPVIVRFTFPVVFQLGQ